MRKALCTKCSFIELDRLRSMPYAEHGARDVLIRISEIRPLTNAACSREQETKTLRVWRATARTLARFRCHLIPLKEWPNLRSRSLTNAGSIIFELVRYVETDVRLVLR